MTEVTREDMSKVINTFKYIKGYDQIPNWDKVYRARWLRPAKNMLEIMNCNAVCYYLSTFCTKWNGYWDLWTAEKRLPDYVIQLSGLIDTRISEYIKTVKEE